MIRRPWMYLAVIAVAVIWGLPEIVLWGLCAVMAVDLIRKWFAPARERLRECEHAALADTLIEDAAGQQWRRSPAGRITAICQHPGAVEVRRVPVPAVGVTDEIVAWWCDACKTQLPADWVPGMGPIASMYLGVEQQAKIRAAFLRAQHASPVTVWADESPAPAGVVWVGPALVAEPAMRAVPRPVCYCAGRPHTGICPDAIRADGYEPVECPAIGEPSIWVPGERLRVPDHPPADYDG